MLTRKVTSDEELILRTMAADPGTDQRTQRRARAIVSLLDHGDLNTAVEACGLSAPTVRKVVARFNEQGWQSLINVAAPRGGDFLARYDQGFWAERLVRALLDSSVCCRAIPYGTSRSEPFTDLKTFQDYAVNEAVLQAWSAGQRWKRPDLLVIPRTLLQQEGGTDTWTPDLLHWNNERCQEYVSGSTAAIEVETSLWQVKVATVRLSFTVKEEDLGPLRNWVAANRARLYIVQVFYDQAYALAFDKLEFVINPNTSPHRRVIAEPDRFTGKLTYNVPLKEGVLLGDIPEPDVEGRIFKASNGRVTVYGRLTNSHIEAVDRQIVESLASGDLG